MQDSSRTSCWLTVEITCRKVYLGREATIFLEPGHQNPSSCLVLWMVLESCLQLASVQDIRLHCLPIQGGSADELMSVVV